MGGWPRQSLDWSKQLRSLESQDSNQLILNPTPIPPAVLALESTQTLVVPPFPTLAGVGGTVEASHIWGSEVFRSPSTPTHTYPVTLAACQTSLSIIFERGVDDKPSI